MGSYEIREQNGLLKNSFRFSCWFCLALLLLVGCGGGDAARPDAAQPTETATIAPVGPTTAALTIPPTLSPTPELPPPTAAPVEAVALAFFRGWEEGDYLRMYAALAPESQAAAVLLEHSGEGSEVAAPVFRRLVELYYGLRPLTPYPAWP
jgi:hypothetical protein